MKQAGRKRRITFFVFLFCTIITSAEIPEKLTRHATDYYVGGTGASDSNPGTGSQPFATIGKAAAVAVAGDAVNIRTGTYRETITPAHSGTPGNPIIFQPDGAAVVTISGADIADGGWSVYNGNIYQKTISLPVNGYNDHATNNTMLMANQVFVNGHMMIEARWPNVSDANDLMKKSDFRNGTIGTWGSVPQLRINCGGPLVEGNQLADKPFTPDSWGYTGFAGTYSTTDAISNTYSVYDAMKTCRYGAGHYLITTQNGSYQVKMDFAEIVDTSSSRKFHIKVEGQTVASNVDIFTLAGGHDRGYEFVFNAEVTDGQMDIEFVAVNGQPMVSEIELNYLRPATLNDPAIPQISGGWVGGQIWINGWYQTYTSPIIAQNGTQIIFDKSVAEVFRKFYYLTGRLGALDVEKEWFYDGTILYLWAPGSVSPANVEVKKRNYAFDLSGKSYITIKDIKIFASTIMSNSSSANIVVDGINAKYISHYVTHPANDSGLYIQGGSGHMLETGILLMGPGNVIQNSEIQYSAGNGIVLGGSGAVAHNNLIHDISYGGKFECAIYPAPNLNNNTVGVTQTITHNTAYRLGRSAIHGIYMNKDIGYNDFYAYGLLSNDVGALYSDCIATLPDDPGVNCTGTRIHHNWLHDCAADERQGSGIYFDQGSGGGAQVDHNVIWNTLETDAYSEIKNRTRIKWYNNTFGSSESEELLYSWLSYFVGGVSDDAKNNIYNAPFHRGAWKKGGNENYFPGDNSSTHLTNPLFENEASHDFHLQINSPAINSGIVIAGVTEGFAGNAPDKGAYEYGGTDWVPGYVAPGMAPKNNRRPESYQPLNSKYSLNELKDKYSEEMMRLAAQQYEKVIETNSKGKWKPTTESIDSHQAPEWFKDAKFGMFIDWGLWSLAGWAPKKEKGAMYPDWYEFMLDHDSTFISYHKKNWGEDIKRDDLIPLFKAAQYQPRKLVDIAKDAGMKYIIPFCKHHGGFCLWPSSFTRRDAMDMGPEKDLIEPLVESCRKEGLKFGFYFSIEEWEYPLIDNEGNIHNRAWGEIKPYTVDLEKKASGKIAVKNYASDYLVPQATEFIDKYDPDLLWYDGDMSQATAVELETYQIASYFYNRAEGTKEVAINDRYGLQDKRWLRSRRGDIFTNEYGDMEKDAKQTIHAWEECRGISQSFGYNWQDTEDNVISSKNFIDMFVDIVAHGGNLLLIVNLDGQGALPEIQENRLKDIGKWLKINGEGIYDTRPYTRQTDSMVAYTCSKDKQYVYAILKAWPGSEILLNGIQPAKNSKIEMLGKDQPFEWTQTHEGIRIKIPDILQDESNRPCEHAWVLKIKSEVN